MFLYDFSGGAVESNYKFSYHSFTSVYVLPDGDIPKCEPKDFIFSTGFIWSPTSYNIKYYRLTPQILYAFPKILSNRSRILDRLNSAMHPSDMNLPGYKLNHTAKF